MATIKNKNGLDLTEAEDTLNCGVGEDS